MERTKMLDILRKSGLKEISYDGELQEMFYLVDPQAFNKPPFCELAGLYVVVPLPPRELHMKLQKFYLTLEEEGWSKPIYVVWYVPIPEGVSVSESA